MKYQQTLINGIQSTQTSALDRGFLYGQSVFETIAVMNGRACLLDAHMQRLLRGCNTLGIPFDTDVLLREIEQFIGNQDKKILRVTLSMGTGGRGYLNPQAPEPCRILSLHDYPNHPSSHWEVGIDLGIAEIRLAHQPALAGIKHGNRLEQVIARSQWHDTWHEALLLDHADNVIEATQSNVFVVNGCELLTPPLKQAGVEGVVREYVIANAHKLGLSAKTMSLSVDTLKTADEVFVTNSVIGLWPVKALNECFYTEHEISHKLLKLMIKNEVIPNYKT